MSLTRNEKQVRQYLANGFSTREVARKLGLSYYTVKAYRVKIMRSLGAKTMAHAINIALNLKLMRGDSWIT